VAFWSLYGALTEVGIAPPVARRMTVFEAAAALGVGRKVVTADGNPTMSTSAPAQLSGMELIKARLAAAERGEKLGEEVVIGTTDAEVSGMMATFAMPSI